MKEKLISSETAKLTKEKGFILHQGHMKIYRDEDGHLFSNIGPAYDILNHCSHAPTQSLLKEWLWKKYKIWVEVTLWGDGIGFICVIKQAKGKEKDGSTIVKQLKAVDVGLACGEPSKALEKGLQEALKLIKN